MRHGKAGRLKDALASLPNKRFDPSIVKVAYVEDFGTAYVDAYEREPFNLNKVDQHGNSMLLTSAPASCDRDDFREISTGKTTRNCHRRIW